MAAKKLPPIADPGGPAFHALASIPKAVPKWYDILTMPGVAIGGGGNWFLDPGAYRAPMMFQLAAEYYKVPNLYNNLLEHLVIMGQNSGAVLGKQFDFQFTYEHNARAAAAADPDYRYVDLPSAIISRILLKMPITGSTRSWFCPASGHLGVHARLKSRVLMSHGGLHCSKMHRTSKTRLNSFSCC